MNEHADQPATPGNQPGIPGQTLQSQREAMGWTVEQVADQLKLAPRQVVAIEAGDYASLPSPAVTRGFVRAYAKLLRIDAAPLVSMIELNMPPEAQAGASVNTAGVRREQRPAAFSETRFPIGGRRNRVPLGWIAAAVVVAGAAVAAWQLGAIPGTAQHEAAEANHVLQNPVGTAAPGEVAAPAAAAGTAATQQDQLLNPSVPLISVPGAGGQAAPSNPAPAAAPGAAPVTTPPAAPATTTTPTPTTTVPTAATTTATAPAVATPAAATPAAAAAGANTLVLNVREDSWIQVSPAGGGRPLISRLVKAGSTESVDLNGPATLTVGAPGGVTATLRGNNVPLPQQPGKTVARVALK